MVLAILMVSVVVISPDDSEGVVLVKVIEAAKEIMPDDKKRGAAPAGAGRLLAFLGAGDARREGPPPGRWSAGDGWAAVIRRQFGGI